MPQSRFCLQSGILRSQAASPIYTCKEYCHAHELGQALCAHLGHHVRPIDLDRPRADAEIVSDDLVRLAFDEPVEDLALALRQGLNARVRFLGLRFARGLLLAALALFFKHLA